MLRKNFLNVPLVQLFELTHFCCHSIMYDTYCCSYIFSSLKRWVWACYSKASILFSSNYEKVYVPWRYKFLGVFKRATHCFLRRRGERQLSSYVHFSFYTFILQYWTKLCWASRANFHTRLFMVVEVSNKNLLSPFMSLSFEKKKIS